MLDHVKLDAASNLISSNYKLMLDAMSGSFAQVLDSPDPTSQSAKTRLRLALSINLLSFIREAQSESGSLFHFTREFMLDGIADAGGDTGAPVNPSLAQHIADMLESLQGTLQLWASRDSQTVERELRKVALQVDLLQGSGSSRVGALIKAKFGKVRNLNLVQVDSIGRKRVSSEFVRSLIRWHLVTTYVDSFLFTHVKNGHDLAKVVYKNGSSEEVFSITGETPGYVTYAEIERAFHPNTTASLEIA